jgi:hypothetical protein
MVLQQQLRLHCQHDQHQLSIVGQTQQRTYTLSCCGSFGFTRIHHTSRGEQL